MILCNDWFMGLFSMRTSNRELCCKFSFVGYELVFGANVCYVEEGGNSKLLRKFSKQILGTKLSNLCDRKGW